MSHSRPLPRWMEYARAIWQALQAEAGRTAPQALSRLRVCGQGSLPSVFAVSDLAVASMGVAGLALSELMEGAGRGAPLVAVDRRLASLWCGGTLKPLGWELLPAWDAVAGDYRAADGWIRLHTNAPAHKAAALAVLGVEAERAAVARAVAHWPADALETAVVERGGCAARMRSLEEWACHPQGLAVQQAPLLHWQDLGGGGQGKGWMPSPHRPLQGIRVLDLTRILAGPVATRFLAGYGAQVLRLDPPGWDEPALAPEVTPGKRCARLDLRSSAGRAAFAQLLAGADVLVHGYRQGALESLGLGAQWRRQINPVLVDVSLNAYGDSGPWSGRRGFDSLIQMSAGIADAGMRRQGGDRPSPLPVQALDHVAGYVMAAAAITGLARRMRGQGGSRVQTSLAGVAQLLAQGGWQTAEEPWLEPVGARDWNEQAESTAWGRALRLRAPLTVQEAPWHWSSGACALGSGSARW